MGGLASTESRAASRKAIELDPDDFIAHWTLGRIHFTHGELDKALELFKRVTELKPAFLIAHFDVKQCYEGLGQTEEALAIRDHLLERLPTYLLPNPS